MIDMATVATKPMTADEFFDWMHRPENRDRHCELEQGEIVEMSLPGERHGVVCGNTTGILWVYTRKRGKGYVTCNDTGLILERDPDTIRGVDVALYLDGVSYRDLNLKYAERLPTLAAEVLSLNDRWKKMLKRIAEFQARGVPLVWLLDPEGRDVTVFRLNQLPVFLEEGDELTGMDVLPDSRCRVAEFFVMPGEAA
jgi:Uma2 family endonuclease